MKNQDDMAKANKSLKKTSPGQSTETQAIRQKGELLQAKQDLQGQCQKGSLESWEIRPSISRTLPHSKRSSHSGAKYGRTTRPAITMVPTGSKTRPRKTSMSQLRNGQTSPQRRPSKPSTRPATG